MSAVRRSDRLRYTQYDLEDIWPQKYRGVDDEERVDCDISESEIDEWIDESETQDGDTDDDTTDDDTTDSGTSAEYEVTAHAPESHDSGDCVGKKHHAEDNGTIGIFTGPRKRTKTCAEQDQDDDEVDLKVEEDPSVENLPPLQLPSRVAAHRDGPSQSRQHFMVKVVFKTVDNDRFVCIVDRDVLLRSALYSALPLPVKFGGYRIPSIQAPNIHSETMAIHAIEYLTRNTIPALCVREDSPTLLEQLQDQIELYDFSIVAGLTELEDAIVQQVAACPDLGVETFVAFASSCYDTEMGHKIARTSSMGKLLKLRLKTFLPVIMRSKEVRNKIQHQGGDLAVELEEILDEHWAAMARRAHGGHEAYR